MKRNQKSVSFGPTTVAADDTESEVKPPPLYPPLNRNWPKIPTDSETLYLVEVYNEMCTNARISAGLLGTEHSIGDLVYPNKYTKFDYEKTMENFLPEEIRNEKSGLNFKRGKRFSNKIPTRNLRNPIKDETSLALIKERLNELEQLETGQIDKQQDKMLSNNLSISQLIDEDDLEIDPDFDFDDEELDEGTDYANNFFDNGEDDDNMDDDDGDNIEGFY